MHPKGQTQDDGKGAGRRVNDESRPGATSSESEDNDEQEDGSSGDEEEESDGSDSGESGEEGESDGEGSQSGSGEEGSDDELESGEVSGSSDEDDEEGEEEEMDGDNDKVKPGKRRVDAFVDSDSSDGQADRCPICLSRFLGQELGSPESCEHMFCLDCIMEWSQTMNTCPVDRHIFKLVFMRKTPDGKILKKLPAHAQNAVVEDDEDATPCEICGRSDREDRLLLCDGCDQGFHMDCLNPPLATIPVEEWFCRQCDTNNHHDEEEADSEQEARLPNDDAGHLTRPRRRAAHVGGTRLLPRTRQSELVRRRIQLTRATRMHTSDDEGPSTSGVRAVTNGHVRRPRRTPVATRRRKTVRRKTTKRRRKTTKRKTSATSSASKKGATTKRRKTRRRKKTRSRKKIVRRTPKATVPSGRSRLADQLGVKKKLPQHFLPEMKEPCTSRWNRRRNAEIVVGSDSLQLFGQRDGLYAFADSYEDNGDDVATVRGVPAHLSSARHRKMLSASAILSRRPVGLSGLSTRVIRRLSSAPASATAVTPSASFDLLGDILNCQTLLQKNSKEVVIQRDGSLRVPVPSASTKNTVDTPIAKGALGATNQCPMEPSRTSQSAVGVSGSSQSGVITTKDGGSSSSLRGSHTGEASRSGRGQTGAGSSDGRSSNRNDGGGDHHQSGDSRCSGSTVSDKTRKPNKRSDEKESNSKKVVVETDDDIDIYSDIETGSLDDIHADDVGVDGTDHAADIDDLEMTGSGDLPTSSDRQIHHHHQRSRHPTVEPGTMDEDSCDDTGRQSDVSSEDDLVIDESVKPVEEEEEEDDEDSNNDDDAGTYKRSSRFGVAVLPNSGGNVHEVGGGGGSDTDSEENDLVIDELDNDREASSESVPLVCDGSSAAGGHDCPSGIEEVSSAEEEEEEDEGPTSPRAASQEDVTANNHVGHEQIADADESKSGSEDGVVNETKVEADGESCSEEEEATEAITGRVGEPEASSDNSEEDCDEDKIVEEYNRNAAKNKEHSRDLVKAVVAAEVSCIHGGGEEAVSSAEEEEEDVNESDVELDMEGAIPPEDSEPVQDTAGEDDVDQTTIDGDEEDIDESHQQSGDEVDASVEGEEDLGEEAIADSEDEVEENAEVDPAEEEPNEENEDELNEDDDMAMDEECEGSTNPNETAEDNPEEDEERVNNDLDNYPSDDHEPMNDGEHGVSLGDDYHHDHDDATEQDLNEESVEQSGETEESGNLLFGGNGSEEKGRRDRGHRRRLRDGLGAFVGSLTRRHGGSPHRLSGRRGGNRGMRDYEEGEIVEDSPPQHRRAKMRKSRPDSPPPNEGLENYEKEMPRVNMSELPRIPKIRRDGGGGAGNVQQDGADSNYESTFDAQPPNNTPGLDEDGDALERERADVLARLEEDRVAADISWKKLSQNSRTRNYRDNKAKAEQIRHVRGGERKTTGVVTIMSGGMVDQVPTRKWAAAGAAAPPEPPPDRERERERERVRDRDKEKKARGDRDRATEHNDKERARTSKESRDARLKESRDARLKEAKDARLKEAKDARLKERTHDRTRSGSKHEKERYKEKDKHKVDRHKSDKLHRDWKEKPKRGSCRTAEPVPERSRERARDSSGGGGGSRYEKREKAVPPPPPPTSVSSDRKEKRERKTRSEKSRGTVPTERDHRDTKHREHRKQRERDKVAVPAAPAATVAPCSREPSPIESKEVYASGDSIIVNVNFSRPAAGTKCGGADVIEVPKEDAIGGGTRAFKIKERERERDPIKKLEIELRERKRQRLSEMEAHRKERIGRGERTKKRVAADPERTRREVGGKRSRMDPSRLGPPHREVLVKGGSAPAASNRWNPFGEEADESMGSERKSGGSVSPIMIRDDDEDEDDIVTERHHHHQAPLHSFEDNSDDDVVEILPSPEDDTSKGGDYQSDEPRTPADEDVGGDECASSGGVGDFVPFDSPPNEPRPPCSPPSPAEDNDSVYDPFEPTKSPSPLSSPEPPAPTQQQQLPATSSVGKPDPPPLPPDMQPPMPPPEPPEQDTVQLASELAPLTTQPMSTPSQTVVSTTAMVVAGPLPSVSSVTPVTTAQAPPPVAIVTPVATPTGGSVAASPVRGLLPPMAMPNIRVPPPNYIPRSVSSGAGATATSPSVRAPHIQQMANQQPRPLNWSVASAPAGMLFAAAQQQQQLNRPGGATAFLRPPPPLGSRPMSLSQIGSLLHSQIASMQQGLRAPQQVSASGLRLQVPLGLPAALLQQSFGSLQQLAQSLSASMPVGVATISQNGELKRGATAHGHQDVTTEVVDMDVDSPYSPGDTVDPDGGPTPHHDHGPRGSSRSGGGGGGDRFDTLAGSRKENVPSRGEKGSSHASSTSKSRSHGAAGSRSASRRKGAESSHSQRKHIVRFEVPERQQAKAARSGGSGQKEGGGSKKGEDSKKEVAVKMDETQLKILDELPSSAVEMQVKEKFLKKLNRQERVIEEVKLAIKPFYNRREITKEEYKEILRKSVPKICHNKAGDINPVKIKALVDGYIRKFKYNRKKETKGGTSKKS